MMNGIIREPEATESVSIGIQYHLIFTLRHKETVIGKRFCRIEIEYEHQVFSHISQNLIPIVIPNFLYRSGLEVLHATDQFQHFTIEIA